VLLLGREPAAEQDRSHALDSPAGSAFGFERFVGRFDVAPFAAEVTAPDDAHAGVARKPALDAFDAFEPVLRPRW